MKIYELIAFQKEVLIAAEQKGWNHTPVHDRCVGGLLSMTFEKKYELSSAEIEIIIDTNKEDIASAYRDGVARLRAIGGSREAKVEKAFFGVGKCARDLFDPLYYIHHGEWIDN
jgi:hypothetical protein